MKDPAFSFYSNDFDAKTKFFSHEQVGMYLRLMISQHQIGHLTENQMKIICGRYDEDVFLKFTKDADGKYFNERLEYEILKRKAFCESRSKNKSGKTKKEKPVKPKKEAAKTPPTSAIPISEREQTFKQSLYPFVGEHPKERVKAFFEYWSEKTTGGLKMRFELQKTWEVKKRLATWARNEKPNFTNQPVKKVSKMESTLNAANNLIDNIDKNKKDATSNTNSLNR